MYKVFCCCFLFLPLGYGLSCVIFLLPVFEQSDKFKSALGLVWLVCARGRRSCVCVCMCEHARAFLNRFVSKMDKFDDHLS